MFPTSGALQAQEGVFLFCPSANFENLYDFDRILFPATIEATAADEARFFKVRKSPLEVLLDQFFMNEGLLEGFDRMRPHFSTVVEYAFSKDGVNARLPADAIPPRLDSWSPARLEGWLALRDERHSQITPADHRLLAIEPGADLASVASAAREIAANALREVPGLRSRPVAWQCVLADVSIDSIRINHALRWLWDGLRGLPHDDADLAQAIGNCVAMFVLTVTQANESVDASRLAARAVLGDAIYVEFGASDGSYSKGYVSRARLTSCLREDLRAFLSEESGGPFQSVEHILGLVQEPSRLFDFRLFARLFACELVPWQVLFRPNERPNSGPMDRSAAFFSPARVTRLGLP